MLSAIPAISNLLASTIRNHFLLVDAFLVVVELPLESAFLVDDSDLPSAFLDAAASATFFLLPDLKSVSYQPPPLRRKAAAETNFFMADLPHSSHFLSGLSLIFCKTSISKPQLVHWYS